MELVIPNGEEVAQMVAAGGVLPRGGRRRHASFGLGGCGQALVDLGGLKPLAAPVVPALDPAKCLDDVTDRDAAP